MTTGEKVKYYRTLKGWSRRALSERSGVSEISIRKYETGERFPKSEQVQKLADALGLNVSYLMDIELPPFKMETGGDFMKLFFFLEKSVGAKLVYDVTEDNQVDCSTISMKFDNEQVRHHLAHWVLTTFMVQELNEEVRRESGTDSPQHKGWQQYNQMTLELTTRKLLDSNVPLSMPCPPELRAPNE